MKAAPLVALFDGWGFMPMVSGDLPHLKFGLLWLVHENGTGLSVLVVSKTTPCPLLRFEHESAFYRVLMHVAKFLRKLGVRRHRAYNIKFDRADRSWPDRLQGQKTFTEALEYQRKGATGLAFDAFKKADKQDGGHCEECQNRIVEYGIEHQDWKAAEGAATELVSEAQGDKATALAHYQLGLVMMREGTAKQKDQLFARANDEFSKALAAVSNFPGAMYADGLVLAHLKQDDAATSRFQDFAKVRPAGDPDRQRALRYISEPALARARMAPAFVITAMDGQRVSLDDFQGKVVLIDFWATWCPSCREALPHIRSIAKSFKGQPLVILSVSLDEDQKTWKDFVTKNEMTWIQYCDGGFKGRVSELFAVHEIPQTFTIDADGVLQDQHIGDGSIEGKLKKLVAKAQELQTTKIASQ